ncbi:MAG TPA: RNase adapter RapZ [Vicinamibacteria bacterium]|nr:RNase adapter RapZ [Vicinamibacteria bacterium]
MADPRSVRFVFITGLSGSGKTLALKALEDAGYFCVDNLPVNLILAFAELTAQGGDNIDRVAIVADIRERGLLKHFPEALGRLAERGFPTTVVFFEARDEVLVRRFSESRRPHPLQGREGSLIEAVQVEQNELAPIRQLASRIFDTSELTVHELRRQVLDSLGGEPAVLGPAIHIVSFGFKYGVPPGADLVFDVRFLPNPFFESALRDKDGNDPEVERYLMERPATAELLERLVGFLSYLLPHYAAEGRANLTIAVGCTGGKHRSVVIGNHLGQRLRGARHGVRVSHRDCENE